MNQTRQYSTIIESVSRGSGAAINSRRLWLVLLVLILVNCINLVPLYAQNEVTWSGSWETRWRDGGALLELRQEGSKVTGRYQLYNGTIEARIVGRRLVGTWREPDQGLNGRFTFVQARDGETFMGRFGSGEWWTGHRVKDADDPKVTITQVTPMDTMRSFLLAMNESGADELERVSGGALDLRGRAANLIDLAETPMDTMNRLDYGLLLFNMIDQLTFRIWDLPQETEGNTVTVTLPQAGTKVRADITFRRIGERWFIVGPPVEEINAKYEQLTAARGYRAKGTHDPRKLRSPRDAFKLFLWGISTYGNTMDNPAHNALNTSEVVGAVRRHETPLVAAYLKQVLDRAGYVYWQEIPNDPTAKEPYVHFEHPAGNVIVAPVETEDGVIWQFAPSTLRSIRELYAAIEDMPLERGLASKADQPLHFKIRSLVRQAEPSFLSPLGPLERWQWGALALAVLLGLAFGYLASAVVSRLLRRRAFVGAQIPLGGVLQWSVRALAFGGFLLAAFAVMDLPALVGAPVKALSLIAIILAALPVTWYFVGRIAAAYSARWDPPGYHATLISLLAGVTRVVLVLIAFLLLARLLAIPYQGVIAGLGLGGLAVALAAQPTLQNFLSGLTLYGDRPVSVGDFCRFGDKLGTIEHIGMRSTKVRSLDRTVITIPNSQFADLQLENYTRRDQNRFIMTLRLRYETTPDQMRYLLAELRKLLIAHPRVTPDPCRVRFVGFGEYSLDVEIFAYIETADYNEFLAIREDLFLRIMILIDEAGTDFAFPAQVEYQAEDKGIDAKRSKLTEEKVAQWRAQNRLPFPDFDDDEKASIKDTLDYPPKGSAAGAGFQEGPPEEGLNLDAEVGANLRTS